jgi:hypothetical protein
MGAGRTETPPAAPEPARATPRPAPAPPPVAEPEFDPIDEAPAADEVPGPPPVAPAPRRAERVQPESGGGGGDADDGDVEGARLIALNMALNGQSREETDRYLAENFDLSDREGLLDEVYSSVSG